jgi:hypothetical protein
MASCLKSRQLGEVAGHNLSGVKISGECAHTHLVRKLIASWLIIGQLRSPHGTGLNLTRGIHVGASCALGVCVRGGQRVAVAGVGIGWRSTLLRAMLVMIGTLLGMLFCVLLT